MSNPSADLCLTNPTEQPCHGRSTGGQKHLGLLLLATLALLLGACAEDNDSDNAPGSAHPIGGNYTGQFGGTYVITNDTLTTRYRTMAGVLSAPAVSQIVEINNAQQFFITSVTYEAALSYPSDCPNIYNPSMSAPVTCYSRDHWEFDNAGRLHYCTYVFGHLTAAAARTASVDPSLYRFDPADPILNNDCGGSFTWTRLTPR